MISTHCLSYGYHFPVSETDTDLALKMATIHGWDKKSNVCTAWSHSDNFDKRFRLSISSSVSDINTCVMCIDLVNLFSNISCYLWGYNWVYFPSLLRVVYRGGVFISTHGDPSPAPPPVSLQGARQILTMYACSWLRAAFYTTNHRRTHTQQGYTH